MGYLPVAGPARTCACCLRHARGTVALSARSTYPPRHEADIRAATAAGGIRQLAPSATRLGRLVRDDWRGNAGSRPVGSQGVGSNPQRANRLRLDARPQAVANLWAAGLCSP